MEYTPGNINPNTVYYGICCFHCGCNIKYTAADVHHQPWLNKIVKGHGFTGHTGEIHCPGCGTWLPHFEQNRLQ